MRGGLARHKAQRSASVASSGVPQVTQPAEPRNSICFQQWAQKRCTSSTITPHPAQRGGSAKSSTQWAIDPMADPIGISLLVGPPRPPHKRRVPKAMFDMELRALRRDRACRTGPELFLHQRAFGDCLERLALIQRRFHSALLIGCPDPDWRRQLAEFVGSVEVVEPGPLFALAAGAQCAVEDSFEPRLGTYDLCLAVGTLDTVNDLPR